jgi:hypothetical protein
MHGKSQNKSQNCWNFDLANIVSVGDEYTTQPPNEFFCPISREIMDDPVLADDGWSYDRGVIELWLKSSNRSPATNIELKSKNLTPNRALRTMIIEWKQFNKTHAKEIDLDDFRCDGWKDAKTKFTCNWTVKVNGTDQSCQTYPIDLELLSRKSFFFSRIHENDSGESSSPKRIETRSECGRLLDWGAIQIDADTFDVTALIKPSDTLHIFKTKITHEAGIPRIRQHFLLRPKRDGDDTSAPIALATSTAPVVDDHRMLADHGVQTDGDAVLLLSLQHPWHSVDRQGRCITLSLPSECAGPSVLEPVLDYLCRDDDHHDELPITKDIEGAPEPALATLWLAGNLQIRPLKHAVLSRLRAALVPTTAHAILVPAIRLGLDAVAAVARRMAASRLASFPVASFCALLLAACCDSDGQADGGADAASKDGAAWASVWASATYFANYHRSGRMDDAAYRRLATLVRSSAARASRSKGGLGSWSDAPGGGKQHFQDLEALRSAAADRGDEGLKGIWTMCVVSNFRALPEGGLQGVPVDVVAALLDRGDLDPTHEDSVYNAVRDYVDGRKGSRHETCDPEALPAGGLLSAAEEERLWATCRFDRCSNRVQVCAVHAACELPDSLTH